VVNSSLNPVLLTLLLPVPIPSLPLLLQETALLGEIWKDVKRTHNSYSFFSRERDPTIADTLERILFIFATLNAGVRYVQGMNEVLAPVRKGTVVWLRGCLGYWLCFVYFVLGCFIAFWCE
jgi:hypothetical protein